MAQITAYSEQVQQAPATPSIKPANSLNPEKIFGYVLLVAGIFLILLSLFFASRLLTGKSKPAAVFNVQAPTINLPTGNLNVKLPEGTTLPPGVSLSPENTDSTQSGFKVIPDSVLNDSLNIGLSYLLFMFIASTGVKLATIGTGLVKDIKVTAREKN